MKCHHHFCVERVPLFNHLSYEEQEMINNLVTHHHFKKGNIIFSPETEPQLSLVAQGVMKVYRLSSNGKEQLLRIAEVGDFEGENFVLGVNNESLYGEAITDTEICVLKQSDFQNLLLQYPNISLKLLTINAMKMEEVEKQTQFLTMEKIEERLALYLSYLHKTSASSYIEIPMKMKELAAFLGTSPETVSRKFKLLEDKNIIERDNKLIKVIDEKKLYNFQ
mgnify:CR=1 FL=1